LPGGQRVRRIGVSVMDDAIPAYGNLKTGKVVRARREKLTGDPPGRERLVPAISEPFDWNDLVAGVIMSGGTFEASDKSKPIPAAGWIVEESI
jgi:hypothetical protein